MPGAARCSSTRSRVWFSNRATTLSTMVCAHSLKVRRSQGRSENLLLGKEMKLRVLIPSDVGAYRGLRIHALHEWPPAFGASVEKEEQRSLREFSERLVETNDRCLIGAFEDDVLVGSVRVSRYDGGNE